jgi:hypothetical protein
MNSPHVCAVFGPRRRLPWFFALALAVGCGGSHGTLLVLGAAGSAGVAGAGNEAGAGGTSAKVPWVPSPDVTWQVQLTGTLDTTLDVQLFYVDADLVPAATRKVLHDAGRAVACYLSVGSFEPWRSDAMSFPSAVVGNSLKDFPKEQWLDIRSPDLRAIMQKRITALAAAQCDGIVPANLEGDLNDTGFSLTAADEHDYALWLNTQTRAAGLSLALSLDESLVPGLMADFDWALAFECVVDGCPGYGAMSQTGKAVLAVEYGNANDAPTTCAKLTGYGLNGLIKTPALDSFRISCNP